MLHGLDLPEVLPWPDYTGTAETDHLAISPETAMKSLYGKLGEIVRIKLPGHVSKGSTSYSAPKKDVRHQGKDAYLLKDNRDYEDLPGRHRGLKN
ncbi:hypothetical protein IscW_ISCW000512 [Ixodes scapularis]|uniref:Uncharacterized protein n=1 Tax=Ixodes scapularis TaxID=6945 RepID=B7P4J9_IXOSC|nr:hypothetical protein IscW_ISCW000512 [Ixodes scapularis]|eukprot:XP_002406149.1 hypothetical protein IscW_ISCW000512 [Ixodes scapularis]